MFLKIIERLINLEVNRVNKVLVINSGINGEHSQSNLLTETFINVLTANGNDAEVNVRDLVSDNLPHLSGQEMQAWMTDAELRTPEQVELAALSDDLLDELFNHDTIVLGMPLYNLGVPSVFKAYIDRISRAGKTFSYTEAGPKGLVLGKKVIVLAARGGQYQGSEHDSQTAYLKSVWGLMGVTDIEFVYAEGLNMGAEIADKALAKAREQISRLAKSTGE